MADITYPHHSFLLASTKADGVPDHAITIEGDLIEINKINLANWGISSNAVDKILSSGAGIPIRMCNSIDPHDCDKNSDRYSQIGYITKVWKSDDGWIKASAAITKQDAIENLQDGTWTPFGKGKWSVSGLPTGEMDDSGKLSNFLPTSISLVIPPAVPAFEGSGYNLVVSALIENNTNQIENKNADDKNILKVKIKGETMADDEKKEPEPKEPEKKEPESTEPKKTESDKKEETMFDQEAVDKQIAEALEAQKAEHEAALAQMTPNDELEKMFAAAKTEAIEGTMDKINRENLTEQYTKLVSASKVLSAPFMVEGKIDNEKLKTKADSIKMLEASVIQTMIDESKLMVAALPGETAFDAAQVPGHVIEQGVTSGFTVGNCQPEGDK